MDPSNRLEYVLGGLKVPATELTPDNRRRIIESILKLMKPQFKYLPEFDELQRQMNFESSNRVNLHKTDLTIVKWGNPDEGLEPTTRVAWIATTGYASEDSIPRRVTQNKLLITQTGKVFLWYERYRIEIAQAAPRVHGQQVHTEVVEVSDFALLVGEDLALALTSEVFKQTLDSLQMFVRQAVNARRARLSSVEKLSADMERITERINFHP